MEKSHHRLLALAPESFSLPRITTLSNMVVASKSDKQTVVDILAESFHDNPSVLHAVGKKGNITLKIRALATYAFDYGLPRQGVYCSSDLTGAAVCYRETHRGESLSDYFYQLQLILNAIGISNVPKLIRKENYIKARRPKEEYLYFWFLGVKRQGRGKGAAREIRDAVFEMAQSAALPIYLETSVEKNRRIYERYGFETYHEWVLPGESKPLYFMRREV